MLRPIHAPAGKRVHAALLRLPAALILASLVGCYGPTLVRSDIFERTTMQVGVIEAPTGPHGTGPQLDRGQIALQGALEYSAVPQATTTRAGGASGALLASAWARGQATFGVSRWLQLGVELEGSPASIARPVATDVSPDGWSELMLRGGFNVRAHFDAGAIALEPFVEVEATSVSWFHNDTLVETVTTYGRDGTTSTSTRGQQEFKRGAYLMGRTGLGFVFGHSGKVQVRAGPFIGNSPWLYGSWSDVWGCKYYADGSSECSGPEHEPAQVSTIFMPGMFANLSVPLGHHIVLNAGGWVDGVPDLDDDTFRVRPGATASVEFVLGRGASTED